MRRFFPLQLTLSYWGLKLIVTNAGKVCILLNAYLILLGIETKAELGECLKHLIILPYPIGDWNETADFPVWELMPALPYPIGDWNFVTVIVMGWTWRANLPYPIGDWNEELYSIQGKILCSLPYPIGDWNTFPYLVTFSTTALTLSYWGLKLGHYDVNIYLYVTYLILLGIETSILQNIATIGIILTLSYWELKHYAKRIIDILHASYLILLGILSHKKAVAQA